MMREVCHGELEDRVLESHSFYVESLHEQIDYVEYAEERVRHSLAMECLPPPFEEKKVYEAERTILVGHFPRFGYMEESPLDVIKAWYEWQGRQIELRKKVIISWRMRDV